MASDSFCRERAESVRVSWSPVWEVEAAADASFCDLSAMTLLLFELLGGATGSEFEYPLIFAGTEVSPRLRSSPCQVIVRFCTNFNDDGQGLPSRFPYRL